jgi:hypothetical protein
MSASTILDDNLFSEHANAPATGNAFFLDLPLYRIFQALTGIGRYAVKILRRFAFLVFQTRSYSPVLKLVIRAVVRSPEAN